MALPATEDFTGAAAALGAGYQQTAMPTSVGRTLDKDGSGHGTVSATGSDTFAYDTANTYNDDQYSQEVINSLTGGSPEPIIRASGTGNTGSGYFTYYTGAAIGIGKYVGGAFTDKGSSAGSYTAGDLVRIEATGTNLTVKKNGASATTATDSGLTSGAAGPGLDGSSPILIDDWEGGNMVTASTGGWAYAGTRMAPGQRGPFDRRGFLFQPKYDYTPSAVVAVTVLQRKTLSPVGTHTGGRQGRD